MTAAAMGDGCGVLARISSLFLFRVTLEVPAIAIYLVALASDEACYSFKDGWKTPQEYIPGKCNIGYRGRAMRLTTGLAIVAISLVLAFTLLAPSGFRLARLVLMGPLYGGFLSILEGTMSFCVFHASRGTYDFFERIGTPFGRSKTRKAVGSEEWRRGDRRKARLMHLEALLGALVVVSVLLLF